MFVCKVFPPTSFVISMLFSHCILWANSSATGFAVNSDGLILTNEHVVFGCSSISTQSKQGEYIQLSLVSVDKQNDLALLKASKALPLALPLRPQNALLGETVYAFGFPLNGVLASSLNMTNGNISALAGIGDDARWLQFTAPIQPGNSGGPVTDGRGNVVGIATSKLSASWASKNIGDIPQNVNFALKATIISSFLESRGIATSATSSNEAVIPEQLSRRVADAVYSIRCKQESLERERSATNPIRSSNTPQRGVLLIARSESEAEAHHFLSQLSRGMESSRIAFKVRDIAGRSSALLTVQDYLNEARDLGFGAVLLMDIEFGWKVRANLRSLGIDGQSYWEESFVNSVSLTIDGATRNVVGKISKHLKQRAGKPGLPLLGDLKEIN